MSGKQSTDRHHNADYAKPINEEADRAAEELARHNEEERAAATRQFDETLDFIKKEIAERAQQLAGEILTNPVRHQKIIFVHIHKTAGISVRHALGEALGDELVLWYDQSPNHNREHVLASRTPGFQLYFGHVTFGAHRLLGIAPFYATILRHPVDRVLSFYRYIRDKHPDHPLYTALNSGMDVGEFAQNTPRSSNYMVKAISGIPGPYHTKAQTADALNVAKKNLEQFFVFIGLYEYLNDGLKRFTDYLNMDRLVLPYKNYGTREPDEALNDYDIELVRQLNRADLELYNHALDMRPT